MTSPLRQFVDNAINQSSTSLAGTIASPFFKLYDEAGNWMYAADVDIGNEQILRSVPVAFNNQALYYAQVGQGVILRKNGMGQFVINGLSKTVNSNNHVIFVSFTDDISKIVGDEMRGYSYRLLTYGELGSIYNNIGYGTIPYGARGRFRYDGTLVELIGEQ